MHQNHLTDLRKYLANWHQLLLDGLKNRHEIEMGRPITGAEWFQVLISTPQFSSALQWNSLIADIDVLLESDPEASQVYEAFQVVICFIQKEVHGSENSVIHSLNETDTEMRMEWQKVSRLLSQKSDGAPKIDETRASELRNSWRARQALKRSAKARRT